jgi:ABC-type Fe3+-hydroxamate transport system substrate-binding protein
VSTRVVSLVPSLTEAVAALGHADRLVGVTRFCTRGAPATAVRLRGTKNPEVEEILRLGPDLVLANREENRRREVEALLAAGVPVHLTEPRTVADVGPKLTGLAEALGDPGAAAGIVAEVDAALAEARARRPVTPVATLTLIWRRPWMAVGPDTYVDDLLATCGFANVLAGWDGRYPRLEEGLALGGAVVLLPSEPYAFTEDDVPAVRRLVGDAPRLELVDGRLLTWHGPSTPEALRVFSALAARLRGTPGDPGIP